MITDNRAHLGIYSFTRPTGLLGSSTSCNLADFPALKHSYPIGSRSFSAHSVRAGSAMNQDIFGASVSEATHPPILSRKKRLKRGFRRTPSSLSGPADMKDDFLQFREEHPGLQSEFSPPNSIWPEKTGLLGHKSPDNLRDNGNQSSAASIKVDDEGFLDESIDPISGTDALGVISCSMSGPCPTSSQLEQASSRSLWIQHFNSTDRMRQDSVSEIGSVVFGSPEVPRVWNSLTQNADSSNTEFPENATKRSLRCLDSTKIPTDTQRDGDLDEDELEVTDLLHLIGSSLDRFNAILHPNELSATTLRVSATADDANSDRATDMVSSDYGSFEPSVGKSTHCNTPAEASDEPQSRGDLQWFRPQLSMSCPEESAFRSRPQLLDLSLLTSECFVNLDLSSVNHTPPCSSDTLTNANKLVDLPCFSANPTGESAYLSGLKGPISCASLNQVSTQQQSFDSTSASSVQVDADGVVHTLTLPTADKVHTASGGVACSTACLSADDTMEACSILSSSYPRGTYHLVDSNKLSSFNVRPRGSLSCSQPSGDNSCTLDEILGGLDCLSVNRRSTVPTSRGHVSVGSKTSSMSQLEQSVGSSTPLVLDAFHGHNWPCNWNTCATPPVESQYTLRSQPLCGRRSVLSTCLASELSTQEALRNGAEQTLSAQSDLVLSPTCNCELRAPGSFPNPSTFGVAFSPTSPLPYPSASNFSFVSKEPCQIPVVLDAKSNVTANHHEIYSNTSKQTFGQLISTPQFEKRPHQFVSHLLLNGTRDGSRKDQLPFCSSFNGATSFRHSFSGASPPGSNVSRTSQSLSSDSSATKPVIAKWRRACSFYLRGHCKKEDCEFAHDLTKVTCKFWEMGECFKGQTCPFLHGYPLEVAPPVSLHC